MLTQYITLNRRLRRIITMADDGRAAWEADEKFAQEAIAGYIIDDLRQVIAAWPQDLARKALLEVQRGLRAERPDFSGAMYAALEAADALDDYFEATQDTFAPNAIVDLLDDAVLASS